MIEFLTIILHLHMLILNEQTIDVMERNANKCVCLLHSIQKNPSMMSDDHPAIMLVNFFHEKYLLAE